jgi:hypothetical protein
MKISMGKMKISTENGTDSYKYKAAIRRRFWAMAQKGPYKGTSFTATFPSASSMTDFSGGLPPSPGSTSPDCVKTSYYL